MPKNSKTDKSKVKKATSSSKKNNKKVVGPVEILLVVDKSGSMHQIIDDAIGGCNTFLEGQKKVEGKANITIVEFDSVYNVKYDGVDVRDVALYDRSTYVPGTSTALYDAVGRGIHQIDQRLMAKDSCCPTCGKSKSKQNVVVAIMTDGYENASREYTGDMVKTLVESHKKAGWEFLYLSAGLDMATARAQTMSMGIGHDRLCCMSINETRSGWGKVDSAVTSYRTTGKVNEDYSNNSSK